MPVFQVLTNVPASKVPADFKQKATKIIADSLSKPEEYIAVHVVPNQDISFGGTSEPAALCNLGSIGSLSTELNKKHSKVLMELLNKSLGVPPTRIYINFDNLDKANVGFDSQTFHDLM